MKKESFLSVVPLLVFVLIFVGSGVYYGDFYALPSPVAVMMSVMVAFFMFSAPYSQKLTTFLEGCGNKNILSMCLIYLLAGAFATVSKSIGSVDVLVHFGTQLLDVRYIPVGVFMLAGFLSLASGTSVGTIVALGPVALGFVEEASLNIHLVGAALLGGAMFGDNLSMISDTTIAATQSQGCKMKDKFKTNLLLALPAAVITAVLYILLSDKGGEEMASASSELPNLLLALPYVAVIIGALLGMNVFLVLIMGLFLSGGLGFIFTDMSFLAFGKSMYEGFSNMQEIFILSLLTGGLAAMVEKAGGISYILHKVKSGIRGKKSALLGIGGLVGLTDMATANNTIAILISGKIAKNISDEYRISPRVSAAVLDIFSCIVQGVLPYGAQILILISFSKQGIHYPTLMYYSFYPALLLVAVLFSIFFRRKWE
ncbi:Na+/H+ antiporter NhaC family protein [Bergeyella zoohelcum]|uniref:Na+/H+ antiporter NhaC-like C-terminal domain-containing protein n=1 Tax=Bergeyella zoohelcum ATCC 43767 TaxID=883096 RepID=K1LY62_9FLAO|nr:Na+/H+ antiporter NhaC family protein [Bergeyella zoohelcum]EKB60061.1 hypothetical protein HMPREF9699_00049 [Bergeyella zoohelcum ATCC 43767]SUV49771.1 Malate-2H(+)/Na(+)-lactate antiporter [Bergeyella zoohelcum]